MNTEERNLISRKEALKKAALAFGGILSTPAALTLLANCSSTPRTSTNRFSDAQRATIETVGDIIIPDTDTVGATKSGAVRLFEDILFDVFDEERRDPFINALTEFEVEAKTELGVSFTSATPDQQKAYIQKIHDEVFGDNVDWDAPRPFIWQIKEAMINTYFATEVGMTQVLQYQMVPGRWDGCLTFEEAGGKVWA